MRLFIALNLPAKQRKKIHKAAEPLRQNELPVRWLDPETYHLTLKFLGEVRPESLPAIEGVMTRIAESTSAFSLELGGFGAFPTIRRPRVLWMGVEPTPALRCLKQDIEWGLADHGYARETRAFHPHITLGRVESENGAGAFRGLDQLAASLDYSGTFDVDRVDLMRSHLSKQGARYTVLQSAQLRHSYSADYSTDFPLLLRPP